MSRVSSKLISPKANPLYSKLMEGLPTSIWLRMSCGSADMTPKQPCTNHTLQTELSEEGVTGGDVPRRLINHL